MKLSFAVVAAFALIAIATGSNLATKIIRQKMDFKFAAGTTYEGNVRSMVEKGYGNALGIYNSTQFVAGCTGTNVSAGGFGTLTKFGCSIISNGTVGVSERTSSGFTDIIFEASVTAAVASSAFTAASDITTASMTAAIMGAAVNATWAGITMTGTWGVATPVMPGSVPTPAPTPTAASGTSALSTGVMAVAVTTLAAFQLRQ